MRSKIICRANELKTNRLSFSSRLVNVYLVWFFCDSNEHRVEDATHAPKMEETVCVRIYNVYVQEIIINAAMVGRIFIFALSLSLPLSIAPQVHRQQQAHLVGPFSVNGLITRAFN